MTLLELAYLRRKAKTEAAGMLDSAVTEGRALAIHEQLRFDSLTARIHELDTATAERESLRKLAS